MPESRKWLYERTKKKKANGISWRRGTKFLIQTESSHLAGHRRAQRMLFGAGARDLRSHSQITRPSGGRSRYFPCRGAAGRKHYSSRCFGEEEEVFFFPAAVVDSFVLFRPLKHVVEHVVWWNMFCAKNLYFCAFRVIYKWPAIDSFRIKRRICVTFGLH